MKATHFKLGLAAFLVIAAGFALAGMPIVSPDLLAAAGLAGFIGAVDLVDVKNLIEDQGRDWQEFKGRNDARHKSNEDALRDLKAEFESAVKVMNRAGVSGLQPGSSANSPEMKAFDVFARTGRELPELKAMNAGDDAAGGYLVPEHIELTLTKYLREISPMRRLARVVNTEVSQYSFPHSTGGTGYTWVGEEGSRPETAAPGLKMVDVPVKEVYASPKITQKLLDDNAFNLETWLVDELSEAFGDGEGDAFINGDGVLKPRGLFTYTAVSTADASRAHDEFQYIPTGGAGDWAGSNPSDALITLIHAVKPRYRRSSSWLLSPEVLEDIRKFKDGQGNYLWQPSAQAGQPSMLLGYPVEEDENLPAIGSNSLSAAFGDFSRAYTIVDRRTSFLRDPYTAKPYVVFYSTKRVGGGGARDTRAVKFLKFAAS